jgi:hypothetical protein
MVIATSRWAMAAGGRRVRLGPSRVERGNRPAVVIGSAKKEMDWSGSQCNLYVNLEDNGAQVMDFQDKYALLDMMYDEANEYYKDNK